MESFAYSVVAAIIGLGVLIVFHEFGHFLVAKLSGVGVITFSVGFGPKLWVRKKGETEYALSAFPLGGYVKMVGEDPDQEVQPGDLEKSFAHKSLLKRIAIVVAGPGFNLLLAVLLLMVVYTFYGVPVMSTQVSGVEKGSPAEKAGIVKGDRIISLDGKTVEQWEDLSGELKRVAVKRWNFRFAAAAKRSTSRYSRLKRKAKIFSANAKMIG
jgi:regulator of sigma E protease